MTISADPAHALPDDPRFVIRAMQLADVELALDWAASEGWNPGLDDARAFLDADRHGFFMGTFGGEPIGCVAAVAYDDTFGFIGLYIVRPEWRAKGFGMRLWRAGMNYLGERNIGLDGVLAQQPNYRKSGFVLAYRNVRYEGSGYVDTKRIDDMTIADEARFDQLLSYDTTLFAANRSAFLKTWLALPEARVRVALDGDTVRGYGVIRRCRSGHKIGPLFADDLPVARALYRSLVATAPNETVFLDVPESNAAAVALAVEHGMTSVFETARMYTRAVPDAPVERVFGVTSFELG